MDLIFFNQEVQVMIYQVKQTDGSFKNFSTMGQAKAFCQAHPKPSGHVILVVKS